MEKEIIGYKLKKDCIQYEEPAARICDPTCTRLHGIIGAACDINNLKKAGVLDLWFEPAYKKEKYKIGDWVVWISDGYVGRINAHCTSFSDSWNIRLDGSKEGQYTSCNELYLRKATLEEIKNALIAEAKRRGFKEGVKVQSFVHEKPLFCNKVSDNTDYIDFKDRLHFGVDGQNYVVIYKEGQWAEILSSYPQIEVNDYEGEFFDWGVRFGCAEIDKQVFIQLYNIKDITNLKGIHNNKSIESVTIGKGIFTNEQIKEIAEYYLNK